MVTELVTHFAEACEPTGATSDDPHAWLARRRSMITASDVAAILGEDPYRDAFTVYMTKVMPQQQERLTIEDPRFWGLKLERPILEIVADYHGWQFHRGGGLLRSRRHPFLGCTLDAEVNRGVGWLPYEGKTTRMPKGWDQESGGLPTHVLIQTQVQLIVTQAPANVVFALLQGSKPCLVDVEPSAEFAAVVIERSQEFMAMVDRMDPPPPTAKATEVIKQLYGQDDGSTIELTREAFEWTRELQEIAIEIKALEDRKEELRNMLRVAMKTASFGVLPEDVYGKTCWKWANNSAGNRELRLLKSHPSQ